MIHPTKEYLKKEIRSIAFQDRLNNNGKLSDEQISYVCDLINNIYSRIHFKGEK